MKPETLLFGYPANASSQAIDGISLDSSLLPQQALGYLTAVVMGTVVNM